ncbi:hypothetical protein TRFO_16819 [Tritrichomonas foetus]|uniref:ATPase AAA-type core domain-containing protein n=1 Tax=Tritrichomonas foetus TaxID=1144522 RepID=A0A1J4KPW6_9EUKA|nr:hypothetical protein TRFO_16819 [Tritrichomonas foetus]|eukprot:OHT13154.1 hypothetical protein TRFO_16819 [Tritrichomonas foetus]
MATEETFFDNQIEKIVHEGKWTITDKIASVSYEISIDEYSYSEREFSLNKLKSLKTKIKVNFMRYGEIIGVDENLKKIYEDFLFQIKDIKNYFRKIQQLFQNGIKSVTFSKIPFNTIQKRMHCFMLSHSYKLKNFEKPMKTVTRSITPLACREIGKAVFDFQKGSDENEDKKDDLLQYIKCIGGINYNKDIGKHINSCLNQIFKCCSDDFVPWKNIFTFFDSSKLGNLFCHFIERSKIIDQYTLKKIEDEKYFSYWKNKISKLNEKSLLFFKVHRLSHCYHCILPIFQFISDLKKEPIKLNENNLFFCQSNRDFASQIQNIPKTSIHDSSAHTLHDNKFFIVHPELLNEANMSIFKEFMTTRIFALNNNLLPKVIIISSLDITNFISINDESISKVAQITIDDDEISFFYTLSYFYLEQTSIKVHCYYSRNSGCGKTYKILNQIRGHHPEITAEIDQQIQSYFIDQSYENLPQFPNKGQVYLSLSPELFDNDLQFFDDMWQFLYLEYYIQNNGKTTHYPQDIYIEIPTLIKSQYEAEGNFRLLDFPLSCHDFNLYDKNDEFSQKESLGIELSENVKQLSELAFNDNVKYTSDLLTKAANLFFKNDKRKFERSDFVPRILNETNIYLNYFCDNNLMKESIDFKIAIFLLLLRSNFHVWNMDSIFSDDKSISESFFILTRQYLFNEDKSSKWVMIGFTSNNDLHSEWDLTDINVDIKNKLQGINDKLLFENELFQNLLSKNDEFIVLSNLNYESEFTQAHFFYIVKLLFYSSSDEQFVNSMLSIMAGKLLQNKNSQEFKNIFGLINKTNIIGEKVGISERIIHSLIEEAKIPNCSDFIIELEKLQKNCENCDDRTTKEINSIFFTVSFVKRFIIMVIRIILHQPLMIEGFTGVGKTAIVNLLSLLITIAKNDTSFQWTLHSLDCHGALQQKDIESYIEPIINSGDSNNHIFFFDELNTSPGSCYVVNLMNDYCLIKQILKQKEEQNDDIKCSFIAAINPYLIVDEFTRTISRVGIKQNIFQRNSKLKLCNEAITNLSLFEKLDINKLAYNVRELSDSTKMILLKSDPKEDEIWTDIRILEESFQIKNLKSILLWVPPDEISTIKSIISDYVSTINISNDIDIINSIVTTILRLLVTSFSYIRSMMNLRSILSYRDVKRFMKHFHNFYLKLKRMNKYPSHERIISDSIILSIMLTIVYRFSSCTRITKEESSNPEISKEKIEDITKKFNIIYTEYDSYYVLDIRHSLLQTLVKVEWEQKLEQTKSNDWHKLVIRYSWCRYYKYIENKDIFKFDSIMIHLFAIASCYSVSKHDESNSHMPCLIIGMPGTSKTLAIQSFIRYKNSKGNGNIFSTTYLSTRASESEGLNAHYQDCAEFKIVNQGSFTICIIDELGLANFNPTRPLKLLHYYFDKGVNMKNQDDMDNLIPVFSIAASNYSLDFANMNRGILICTDLPDDNDIAKSFAMSYSNVKYSNLTKNDFYSDEEKITDSQFIKQIKIFQKFLSILWENTQSKQRPSMLALRPLYLLYQNIFRRNINIDSGENIDVENFCCNLVTVIDQSPLCAYDTACRIITELIQKLNDDFGNDEEVLRLITWLKTQEIMMKQSKITNLDMLYSLLFHNSIEDKRAICIRTNKYECLDFINDLYQCLYDTFSEKITGNTTTAVPKYIFPHDFQQPENITADYALKLLINNMTNTNDCNLFVVGNAPFTDGILDLLNAPQEMKLDFSTNNTESVKPLISRHGFSLRVNKYPSNIRFIFIMNEDELKSKNSTFPLPLLDRLNQVYIDFDSLKNEFSAFQKKYINSYRIESILNFRETHKVYQIPCTFYIHNYFSRLVNTIQDVPVPKEKDKFSVIFLSWSDNRDDAKNIFMQNQKGVILVNVNGLNQVINKPDVREKYVIEYILEEDGNIISEFDEKITYPGRILILIPNNVHETLLLDYVNVFKNENTKDNYEIYWNFSTVGTLNTLDIPKPDKSFEKLKNSIEDATHDNNNVIILTRSPLMEPLPQEINENSFILFDTFIESSNSLLSQIDTLRYKKNTIIIRSSNFSIEHDRHLRVLLEGTKFEKKIIIYHLSFNMVPDGLFTSENWPVFWIESITNSSISEIGINDIVEYSLDLKNIKSEHINSICFQLYYDIMTVFMINSPDKNVIELYHYDTIIRTLTNKIIQEQNFSVKKLFYIIKDPNEYKTINIKRLFFSAIVDLLPELLSFFYYMLISNAKSINTFMKSDTSKNMIDIFSSFICELYDSDFSKKYLQIPEKIPSLSYSQYDEKNEALLLELILYPLNVLATTYLGPLSSIMNQLNDYMELMQKLYDHKDKISSKIIKSVINNVINLYYENIKKFSQNYSKCQSFSQLFQEYLENRGTNDQNLFLKHITPNATKNSSIQLTSFNDLVIYHCHVNDILTKIDNFKKNFQDQKSSRTYPKLIECTLIYHLINKGDDNKFDINSTNIDNLISTFILGEPFSDAFDRHFGEFIQKCDPSIYIRFQNSDLLHNFFYFKQIREYCQNFDSDEFVFKRPETIYSIPALSDEDYKCKSIDLNSADINGINNAEIVTQLPNQISDSLFEKEKWFKAGSIDITNQKFFRDISDKIKGIKIPNIDRSNSYSEKYDFNKSIFELIKEYIFQSQEYKSNSFAEWFLDETAPLICRQLLSILFAIQSNDYVKIRNQMKIFGIFLNPWNSDPRQLILFWDYFSQEEKLNDFLDQIKIISFLMELIEKMRTEQMKESNEQMKELNKKLKEAFEKLKNAIELALNDSLSPNIKNMITDVNFYYICNDKFYSPKVKIQTDLNYELDRLLLKIALFHSSEYEKYLVKFFKNLPFLPQTQELPLILNFFEHAQRLFIEELDILYLILNTLNCEQLTRLDTGFLGFPIYLKFQNLFYIENMTDLDKLEELNENDMNELIKVHQYLHNLSSTELTKKSKDQLKEEFPLFSCTSDFENIAARKSPNLIMTELLKLRSKAIVKPKVIGELDEFYQLVNECINQIFLHHNLEQKMKHILLYINTTFPDHCAYDQINLYVNKLVDIHNSVFCNQNPTHSKGTFNSIKLNSLKSDLLYPYFDFNFLIVPFLSIFNQLQEKEKSIEKFLCSLLPGSINREISIESLTGANISKFNTREHIFYHKTSSFSYINFDCDFMGFNQSDFAKSLINRIDFNKVRDYLTNLKKNQCFNYTINLVGKKENLRYFDPQINEKVFATILNSRSEVGDEFDALSYLILIFSKSVDSQENYIMFPNKNFEGIFGSLKVKNRFVSISQFSSLSSRGTFKSRWPFSVYGYDIVSNVFKRLISQTNDQQIPNFIQTILKNDDNKPQLDENYLQKYRKFFFDE